MWKSIVERGRPLMTIWRMRTVCRIPKATNTPSGCVIFIAFPPQQWFHERASMLRYIYIVCLVNMWEKQQGTLGQIITERDCKGIKYSPSLEKKKYRATEEVIYSM